MLTIAGDAGRLLHRIAHMGLALGVAGLVALLVLSWRLSQGPLPIDWAARPIADAVVTPGGPVRLTIGHASLRWGGFASGAEQGLQLLLQDGRLADARDETVGTAARLDLSVSLPRLLIGQVVPRTMALSGLDLRLRRDLEGRVELDMGGQPAAAQGPSEPGSDATVAETLAELARPATGTRLPTKLQHIEQMQAVHIERATLHVQDAQLGPASLDIAGLDLRRQRAGGVRGTASATLALGAAQATVALQADLAPAGGTLMQIALAPLNAAGLQAAAPGLATADTLDAAIQGIATLALNPDLRPTAATLRLEAGAGHLRLAGTAIGFDSVSLDASAEWVRPGWSPPQQVVLEHSRAVLRAPGGAWPTTFTLAAQFGIEPGRLAGRVNATLDHLAFADIAALWPERLGGHIRPWLVPNVTAGTARDGALQLGFETPLDASYHPDLANIVVKTVDGSLRGEDVTVWWVRPVPPVEQAQAVLTINRPDFLDIAIATARQGAMPLKDGLIHITGLQEKDQYMALGAGVQGNVAELIALLRHPRLQLLDRKPIPMRNPAGTFTGRLGVNMMLKDKLAFEDVHIQASTHATGLRLGGLVAGRDLDRGDIQLEASSETLKATGSASIAGIASDIAVDMDFRPGPPGQVVQRAQATARATGKQLAGAGLDPGSLMPSGAGQFTARYGQRRDGTGEVQVNADLRDAGLALAGWRKPPGPPADAAATLLLRGDALAGIDQLHAQGPGMAVDGRIDMAGTRLATLVLDRLVLGSTQARGEVRLPATPAEPIRATLSGPVLDLSAQLAQKPSTARSAAQAPGPASPDADPAWTADIRFDRVLLSADRGVTGVVGHAEYDGRRLSVVDATTAGPESVVMSLKPQRNGRHLVVRAADGGAALRAADVLDKIRGGQLSVDASYDDTGAASPLAGTLVLEGFSVRDAPVLGKLLQAVTIYGVMDALSGPGLGFSKLVLPFRWNGSTFEVSDAQAFSASLGLTARGQLDMDRKTVAVQGTIVPLYMFNSLLGRIPVLGRLFSSESGGGLLAVNYGVNGPLAEPSVSVNPLSALTPGALRGLFHILD